MSGYGRASPDRDAARDRSELSEIFARFARAKAHRERKIRSVESAQYELLRDDLVVAHISLVRYLAGKFANRGEALDDLIQVGAIGLLKAIDRFDSERGVEFTTYATPTIVGEIKRYFRDKGWAVKVPRRLQELNLAVNRAVERLTIKLGRSPTVAELATHLDVTPDDILEAQELGGAYNLISLDADLAAEGRGRAGSVSESVGKPDETLAFLEEKANLEQAFLVLTKRERTILFLRFFESVSQTEIAKRLGVSQMHVSRLQHKALEKLREAMAEKPV
jgi:RNA polymerase sigma-B factor